MERAMMRRKRQRNHRRIVSVIAALFLVFQLTVKQEELVSEGGVEAGLQAKDQVRESFLDTLH